MTVFVCVFDRLELHVDLEDWKKTPKIRRTHAKDSIHSEQDRSANGNKTMVYLLFSTSQLSSFIKEVLLDKL